MANTFIRKPELKETAVGQDMAKSNQKKISTPNKTNKMIRLSRIFSHPFGKR